MMSLEQNVHEGMPPVYLIHCKKDKTVDYKNALYYNDALIREGIPCEFTLFEDCGHGFGINPNRRRAPLWTTNFILWLNKRYP